MDQTFTPNFQVVRDTARNMGLYNASVDIQENTPPTPPLGGPGTWANVSGLVDIPATLAADIFMTRISQSEEIRQGDRTRNRDKLQVTLDGYFPTITKKHRAVITVTHPDTAETLVKTLGITGVEHASQLTFTRLSLDYSAV